MFVFFTHSKNFKFAFNSYFGAVTAETVNLGHCTGIRSLMEIEFNGNYKTEKRFHIIFAQGGYKTWRIRKNFFQNILTVHEKSF